MVDMTPPRPPYQSVTGYKTSRRLVTIRRTMGLQLRTDGAVRGGTP